jgi:hypothetical protein
MGVGPEQNFTYIASIRPQMVFIVDIRRQAVMQHLCSRRCSRWLRIAPSSSPFFANRARLA